MAKELIAYFSRKGDNYVNGAIKHLEVGNTEVAARMIRDLTGADMFQIEPMKAYSDDYKVCIEEAKRDKGANIRPEFKNPPEGIAAYDTIYLGFPNYWGTMPMHVWTFLEKYDFTGKTIKPFCTHEGSDIGSSEQDIKKLCPNSNVESALSIHGASVGEAKDTIEEWLQKV